MATYIIGTIVLLALAYALYKIMSHAGCCGDCSGNCGSCSGKENSCCHCRRKDENNEQ